MIPVGVGEQELRVLQQARRTRRAAVDAAGALRADDQADADGGPDSCGSCTVHSTPRARTTPPARAGSFVAAVIHTFEKEAGRRGGQRRRAGPTAPRGNPAACAGRQLAAADRGEDADETPDHAPEEMGADDPHEDEIAVLDDLQPIDEHPGGLLARLVGAERRVVLHADERARRLAHPRDVERLLDPPDVGLEERRLPAGDLIEVAARLGVVPGVEAVRRLVDPPDVDVRRQRVVDAAGAACAAAGRCRSRDARPAPARARRHRCARRRTARTPRAASRRGPRARSLPATVRAFF